MIDMAEKPRVLLIGVDQSIQSALSETLSASDVIIQNEMNETIFDAIEPAPVLVICGPPQGEMQAGELAQGLRMTYATQPLFLICEHRSGYDRKLFKKNGFTDAFLLPMDRAIAQTEILSALASATKGQVRVFKPVQIVDLQPGDALEFETRIFMPVNRKYVRVGAAGDELDAGLIERLKAKQNGALFVPQDQMGAFYDYSAKRLKALTQDGAISVTERKERLSKAVRDLIGGIFDDQAATFESGHAFVSDCGEIVKRFVITGAENDWYERVTQVMGERGDTYSHAGNVSTYAALFSMGTGIGIPEDMALAGMLHDIGLSLLPPNIQLKEVEELTRDEFELYKNHPDQSVNLIKEKKIIATEITLKAIAQHHELYNGQGYPRQLYGDRICKEAQILALADRFDYLTRSHPGKPVKKPREALEQLKAMQLADPSKIHYNPEILKKLIALFPDDPK
jgi:HD-GYP domain-containing protein (c-di-GMP phosphodiesterase class II)